VIIDASALVAIMRNESDALPLAEIIARSSLRRISAAGYVETALVVDRDRDPHVGRKMDYLIEDMRIIIEPVTEQQARIAREAYRDFGRGSGHRAKLNFGDCFAYALAKALNEPLLYKGADFSHTDVIPALR
jgi:ribonuclease VapC